MHFLFLNIKGNEEEMRKIFKYYFEDETLELNFLNLTQNIKDELILNPYRYDVIFCELVSGRIPVDENLLLCKYLWLKNNNLVFIFIVKNEEVNISVYTVPHIYVIKKPLSKSNFSAAMERLLFHKHQMEGFFNRNILLRWKSGVHMIDENSIIHIRRIKHGTEIISTEGLFRHSESMETFFKKINTDIFCRCAYSSIVNVKFVKRLEGNALEMSNGDLINIPRSFRHNVKEFIYESLNIKIDIEDQDNKIKM